MDPVTAVKGAMVAAKGAKWAKLAAVMAVAATLGTVVTVASLMSAVSSTAGARCSTDGGSQQDGGYSEDGGSYVTQEPSEEAVSDIPSDYLELYRSAGEEYGIDWAVLAGIGKVETDHGRYSSGCAEGPMTPYGTAKGPMQFIDSTWETMGVDENGDGAADPCDPEDAIPAAANYLKASGAPDDYYSAIYAYNHADWYVEDVMGFAEEYRAVAGGTASGEDDSGSMPALIAPAREAFVPAAGRASASARAAAAAAAGAAAKALGAKAALAETLGWDLVDSNKNLHYEDHTAYDSALEHAVSSWSGLGSVNIEPSPDSSETDVKAGDAYLQGSMMGITKSEGSVLLNPSYMDMATPNAQNATATHELGHAVGLDHTSQPSVMNVPIIYSSDSNHESPTDYDEQVFHDLHGEPAEGQPVSRQGGLPGDGGGAVESGASAVFPLPSEFEDDFDDTWGAARGQGGHEGTDIFAPDGTPIHSITSGEVVPVAGGDSQGWNELGGWTVMIEATESVGPIQAGDTLYYAHMMEPTSLQAGDTVEAGDVVGSVGSTGEGPPGTLLAPRDLGQHLHLGWYDPSGARAEAASGAMNPYPMLQWLKGSGGSVSGGSPEAGPKQPGYCPPESGLGPSDNSTITDEGGQTDPGSGDASELLENPNFSASDMAVQDLQGGIVDERLISTLQAIAEEHAIHVSVIKTGHPYGAYLEEIGMPDVPNSHLLGQDRRHLDGGRRTGAGRRHERGPP